MPLISGNYDPSVGILMQVAVILPDEIDMIRANASGTATKPHSLHMAMGLIDTGASSTCISKSRIQNGT